VPASLTERLSVVVLSVAREEQNGYSAGSYKGKIGTQVFICRVKVQVNLSLCLRYEGVWSSGCIDAYSLDFGTSLR
jgi:hypothetical protein